MSNPAPQSGEVWLHKVYGRVKIIRPWNKRESVCDVEKRAAPLNKRRAVLMNCLMTKLER